MHVSLGAAAGAPNLRWVGRDEIESRIDVHALCIALAEGFRHQPVTTPRLTLPLTDAGRDVVVLLMSAARPGGLLGVKIVHVDRSRSEQSLRYTYLVLDATSGEPLALLDGKALTLRRTAAVSVLAATRMAKHLPKAILFVGAGPATEALALAYAATFKSAQLQLWARRVSSANELAQRLGAQGVRVAVVTDLSAAVPAADIVSCATSSTVPVVRGEWLRPGTHVDLVGGFKPDMRETDDEVIASAATIVVDNEAAADEAGDLVQPIRAGLLRAARISTLQALLNGSAHGRSDDRQITVFKSVGHALADLVAAEAILFAPVTDVDLR